MKCFRTLNLKVLSVICLIVINACQPEKTIVDSPNLDLSDHALVKNWYSLALELGPKCNGYEEPIMARSLAYFSILLNEALYRGIPDKVSLKSSADGLNFNLPQPDLSYEYNWSVVANDAAMTYFENVYGCAGETISRAKTIYDKNNNKFAAHLDSTIHLNSSLYGKQLAHALIKFAETDGKSLEYLNVNPSNYVLPKGPGLWIPTTPDYTQHPVLPYWGSARPIMNSNVNSIILGKELTYSNTGTSIMYSEAVEVYNNTLAISDFEREDAAYFSREMGNESKPLYRNFLLAIQLMTEKQLNLPKSLELLTKLSFAMNDAYIATYKYNYSKNLLRVSTYIRQNIDRTFQPVYRSYTIPEGVSDKSVIFAASAEILANFFGYRQTFTDRTQIERVDLRNKAKVFDSFLQMSIEASLSDIYSGVHFRTSTEAGRKLGTDIARNIMTQIKS